MKDAQLNNKYAQFKIGLLYYLGDKVEQDNKVALKWFLKSATN